MEKKLLSIFFFYFIIQTSFSQEKRVEINGVVINPFSKVLKNSHIVNLSTKKGTISNDNGAFTINAKKGDWIQITNIQYYSKKVRITQDIDKNRFIRVFLLPITNHLDEVVIKRKLKGFLSSDRVDTPKDTINEKMKSLKSIIMAIGYEKIMKMKIGEDERHLQKPKSAQLTTDPVAKVAGLPPATISLPDGALKAKRARRKNLNFKEQFPEKLKTLFGEHFFYVRLKIPKEKYYHFISYCNPLDIEKLYKEEKHLEILKILLKESKSYLLLLENSK